LVRPRWRRRVEGDATANFVTSPIQGTRGAPLGCSSGISWAQSDRAGLTCGWGR